MKAEIFRRESRPYIGLWEQQEAHKGKAEETKPDPGAVWSNLGKIMNDILAITAKDSVIRGEGGCVLRGDSPAR